MLTYWQLLLLIVPVFSVVAVGVGLRRMQWVDATVEAGLIKMVINVFMPCLIFESVVGNASMRDPGNLVLPPLVGFGTTVLAIGMAYQLGKWFGFKSGTGLRTFALTVGIANYGYLPLPIMSEMFGPQSRGVLLVHNIGVEVAVWTMGVLVLSGWSAQEARRRLVSPILITLFVAVTINLVGAAPLLPKWFLDVIHSLAVCAIPLGLLLSGLNLAGHLGEPKTLFEPKTSLGSMLLRLGVFPLLFLALARWLPCSVELKRVIVVQGAMPTAIIPIILAQHYGGRPLTAVQIVLGTTALAVVITPVWLRVGLAWVGV